VLFSLACPRLTRSQKVRYKISGHQQIAQQPHRRAKYLIELPLESGEGGVFRY
jgi:hypothetical protein